jgi:hypothetical protein
MHCDLRAVLLVLSQCDQDDESSTPSHVVGAFPCFQGGDLVWMLCDTREEACSPRLASGLDRMRVQDGFDSLDQITCLISW